MRFNSKLSVFLLLLNLFRLHVSFLWATILQIQTLIFFLSSSTMSGVVNVVIFRNWIQNPAVLLATHFPKYVLSSSFLYCNLCPCPVNFTSLLNKLLVSLVSFFVMAHIHYYVIPMHPVTRCSEFIFIAFGESTHYFLRSCNDHLLYDNSCCVPGCQVRPKPQIIFLALLLEDFALHCFLVVHLCLFSSTSFFKDNFTCFFACFRALLSC